MTDLEISKALAIAIGWEEQQLRIDTQVCVPWKWCTVNGRYIKDRLFDYRDWNVISPIAEKYNSFPYAMMEMGRYTGQWNAISQQGTDNIADTPQKAIALAVINGAKK